MSSDVRRGPLDAFLVRTTMPSQTSKTIIFNETTRSEDDDDDDSDDDDDENVNPATCALWVRLVEAGGRARRTSESGCGTTTAVDGATAVKRAAYAYGVKVRNERRRAERSAKGNGRSVLHDLNTRAYLRASARAERRMGASVSGTAARATVEYGACALPHVSSVVTSAANNAVSAVEFDVSGELVTTGTVAGAVDVQEVATLRAHCGELYAPTLKLATGRYIESLRWNRDRSMIMTTCDTSNTIVAYQGNSTRVPGPRGMAQQTLVLHEFKAQTATNEPAANGLREMLFDPSDPHRLIAGAGNGQAYVWDTRSAGGKQTAQLCSHVKSPISSIVMSQDGHTVIGGDAVNGEILIWDMRKPAAQGSAVFGTLGDKAQRYGLIAQLSMAKLLTKTALGTEMKIEHTGVHWIDYDPYDHRRLGFHLTNGWSGIIDLMQPCVTHAHCPPPPWLEAPRPANLPEGTLLPGIYDLPTSDLRRRKACWLPDGRSIAVGLGVKPGVRILDLSSSKSRHWVHGLTVADLDCEPECGYASGRPPVFVETSTKIYTVAAHPYHHGEIVAGGESSLSLLGYRLSASIGDKDESISDVGTARTEDLTEA